MCRDGYGTHSRLCQSRAHALARMLASPPRSAPAWLTPEHVIAATPLDGLDLIQRENMRTVRILLLLAVARRAVNELRALLR